MKFEPVTEEDILCILKSIKAKGDCELITTKILQDAMPIIGNVFKNIINCSLKTGIFPESWRKSTIQPVPKVKSTKNANEMRPINIRESFGKSR